MAQVFSRRADTLARAAPVVVVLLLGALAYGTWSVWWSPYMTWVKVTVDQPVPFSHQHHVDGLGIDCRYCHTSVETSPFAGVPSTETCMTCHSQVWADAPALQPVRESFRTGTPIAWNRVHDLPDFVFFDHSIHVAKGVGCTTCHGQIDRMPLTHRAETLYMKWCLDCHRDPAQFIRPRDEVFRTDWRPHSSHDGARLVEAHGVHTANLTDCSICHR